jgi:hypothetical protein
MRNVDTVIQRGRAASKKFEIGEGERALRWGLKRLHIGDILRPTTGLIVCWFYLNLECLDF